jgi:hypothetical protein
VRDVAKKTGWTLIHWHVAGAKPEPGIWKSSAKWFDRRPSNKEVYSSLEEVFWSFGLEKGSTFVSCAVCENNWREAIRESPSRFFGGSSEK